jgi:uncharacterized protein involved in exopolysaccharide biosynthesis/Mrp family chromosome partitioning ATPase
MNNPETIIQGPSMTMGDIYYVLFRHKWKIVLMTLVGLIAATAFYLAEKPPYESEGKLFIRYVTEGRTVAPPGEDTKTKSVDQTGETIINSELQILTSLDLAKQVAQTVGPERILAKFGGGKDPDYAAIIVRQGLLVDVPQRSSVIRLVFRHPDPNVVQPVLAAIIDAYLKKHVEIHEAVGIVGDYLSQETDQLRSSLAQTEEELRKARDKAGVVSLEQARKSYAEQIARLQQDILSSEAELAERSAALQGSSKLAHAGTSLASPEAEVPTEQITRYQDICLRLSALKKHEQEMLTQYTEQSVPVTDLRAQIADVETSKKKIEGAYPQLARSTLGFPANAGTSSDFVDPATEAARLKAIQFKIKVLNAQLEQVRADAAKAEKMDVPISDLLRKEQLQEANYKYYAASLEQSRIDEALGAGRVSNISQIQSPSPPFSDRSKTNRMIAMIAAGGIAAGLAWAFLIELFLDRTVRRAVDVERLLKLPLFLTIPDLGRNWKRKQLAAAGVQYRLGGGKGEPDTDARTDKTGGSEELVRSDAGNALRRFHETLRDRLIGYFERRNLVHKPKLVAVTSLGRRAGVTTTAAGLAGSLSETGDGNVLLVDMTPGQGSAQQFCRGNAVCGLDEIFTTRDSAQVHDNLYVVSEEPGKDKLSQILPQRFTRLVPKLKAIDFDYIIFDMPPVSQISITPRLAGFMDMVLLVVESEKTDRDIIQRATALLAESKAHVGVVLNRTRSYVPTLLNQESLLDT